MRASDIMTTDIVSVNLKDTVFDAAEMLLGARVSAAPVVDEEGHVYGIVSEADLIHRAEIATGPRKSWLARLVETNSGAARDFVATHARNVADVMTRDVITASADATLGELVALIEKHKVKRVPIVRDGLLVGIVSRANLLEALLSRDPGGAAATTTGADAGAAPDDKALREAVAKALEGQPWSSRWPTTVVVSDGTVHLWGFVEGEAVRRAYRVAAENVPGVRHVKSHLRSLPASVGMGT